jgi:predicted phosphodiesterase
MRALLISDIHSNLPALDAVLSAAPAYDEVWNLGDIVGYGANPNEVTSKVRSLGGIVVRGNHDRACSGVMARSKLLNFSSGAWSAAIWTKSALSEDNREWLSKLPCGPIWPLKPRVLCVHGSPGNEDEYLFFHDDVWAVLCDSAARIILHGHTHCQIGWSWYRGKATAVKPTFQSKTEMEHFELPIR